MTYHIPVMRDEAIDYLNIQNDSIIVDCTLGGGGHSVAISKKLGSSGKLIAFDWDTHAISEAQSHLNGNNIYFIHKNFTHLQRSLTDLNVKATGVLIDCGISSNHIDQGNYGISYSIDGPLNMRMDNHTERTAKQLIKDLSEVELANVIYNYGEERQSRKIARLIKENSKHINTTFELKDVVLRGAKGKDKIGILSRVFQALRIAVNDEIENIRKLLDQLPAIISTGGRFVAITFHSLEDRLIKQWMKEKTKNCICPSHVMRCECNHSATVKILTKKVIRPSNNEIKLNSRSRSAKLRACEFL